MTLVTRALRPSDVPAVAEILAEAEAREPAGQFWGVPELEEQFASPVTDLEHGSIAVTDDGRLVACGVLTVSDPARVWTAYALGDVRTGYLRRGLGRQVVTALKNQAQAMRDRHDPTLPGELKMWIPERRGSVTALATALGFQTWRYFQDMRHDLQSLPDRRPLPAGLRLEPWSAELDDATRTASNEAFADHWGSAAHDPERWRATFADSSMFRPAESWLAVDQTGVVSFVLVEEFDAETEATGYRTAYLARVGTARRGRGRGVASALLIETLRAAADAGYRYADLNVDSDSPTGAGRIYERVGFRPTHSNRVVGIRF